MAFTAAERVSIKKYMGDFSEARDASIDAAEAEAAIEAEIKVGLTRLTSIESNLGTARAAAVVSRAGKNSLNSEGSRRLQSHEGWRICQTIGDLLRLAPLRDVFENCDNEAGSYSLEDRGWA